MNIRQIQEAREHYSIDEWSQGYFGIDDRGLVVAYPTRDESKPAPLLEILADIKDKNVQTPVIMRFPQIIDKQLDVMHSAFANAIKECSYNAGHFGVFPYKVNSRREFIDRVVAYGKKYNYGLEVGSKTEFIAALSYPLSENALFVCNGFKDKGFIELGYIAANMGKNVHVVVEGPDELATILDLADRFPITPSIGLRFRLYSRGSGKWEKSSGEASKFGLTTMEALECLKMLSVCHRESMLSMLHFHIGSQITEIKRVKSAMKEASRVWSKIHKMGFAPKFLNIGGGVGVDYDGSKTSFQSSANYSIQEFANDVVYVISDICKAEGVPNPNIVTESGRVIAAYHSVVAVDIREIQTPVVSEIFDDSLEAAAMPKDKTPKCLQELMDIRENINRKNYSEYYHDAIVHYEELFVLFNLGLLQLEQRAFGEKIFYEVCHKTLYFSSFERHQSEEFESLQRIMMTKYLANFSIFQSIPDSWSIDQLFPIMPLSHHGVKPTQKSTIVDITCDSDGCLAKFIGRKDVRSVIDLHSPEEGEPYYLGFFLVGAYQEALANEHNLFGAINEVEIEIDKDGGWTVDKVTEGDTIGELLVSRNYNMEQIIASFEEQIGARVNSGKIDERVGIKLLETLKRTTKELPYLSSTT